MKSYNSNTKGHFFIHVWGEKERLTMSCDIYFSYYKYFYIILVISILAFKIHLHVYYAVCVFFIVVAKSHYRIVNTLKKYNFDFFSLLMIKNN